MSTCQFSQPTIKRSHFSITFLHYYYFKLVSDKYSLTNNRIYNISRIFYLFSFLQLTIFIVGILAAL